MSLYNDALQRIESLSTSAEFRPGVPKLIHQPFWGPAGLPAILRDSVEALKARNPGWTHRLYSDVDIEDFIKREYGVAVLQQYLRIDPRYGAARADLFRYLCIYRYGGVYLDVKSTAHRPLDDVLLPTDSYLLSHWQNAPGQPNVRIGLHPALSHVPGGEYQQWFIVGAPWHPFLKEVILRVLRNIESYRDGACGVGRKGVVAVTGPIAYTLAIHPLVASYPCRLVDICTDCAFQFNVHGRLHEQPNNGFPIHYSRRRAPVVRMSLAAQIGWLARRMLRQARTALARLRTNVHTRLTSA